MLLREWCACGHQSNFNGQGLEFLLGTLCRCVGPSAAVEVLAGDLFWRPVSTVNARTDRVEKALTYRNAWKRGQRCIIPASSFDEPSWESGKNEWWRFRRADGNPWGVAGLWDVWTDQATGEEWDSYTMLTINANLHPLMSRMHKIERDPVTKQLVLDKRSVVPLEAHDFDRWLTCTVEEAREMLMLPSVDLIETGPVSGGGASEAENGNAEA